jgi:hypothetical protein
MRAESRLGLLAVMILVVGAPDGRTQDYLAKCKKADGSLYVGSSPPAGCTSVGSLRSSSGESTGSSWKPGALRPKPTVAPDTSAADAGAARKKEIERKRAITALAVQTMVVKRYRNGLFFEGTIANGAEFPVYSARICIEHGSRCEPIAPSTLQPGAQGTFTFEVGIFNAPDYNITWDVVPPEQQ